MNKPFMRGKMPEKICKNCKFFHLLGRNFCNVNWYENAGECGNPEVYDNNCGDLLVRAGGSDGDGDYFHVKENFGCVRFNAG
uniref:Uncharacterized protein n=2 Tax=viral metagenome TaxID=1070528 RepID=A0A6M3JD43_9ZZZZ